MIVKNPASESEKVIQDTVEAEIRSFLNAGADLESAIGISKDPLRPVVDSLVIAEVLVQIEPLVKCRLPESIIKKGGYHSIDEVVSHLVPQVMVIWNGHQE